MSTAVISTEPTKASQGLLVTAAVVSGVIGGGVVGHDYARWIEIDPFIGATVGFFIGLALAEVLAYLARDPQGRVKSLCSTIGALLGLVFGAGIGAMNDGGAQGLGLGAVIGVVIGGVAGRLVAMFISLAALLLLFVSRGPVGLYLRNIVLADEQPASESALQALVLPEHADLLDAGCILLTSACIG